MRQRWIASLLLAIWFVSMSSLPALAQGGDGAGDHVSVMGPAGGLVLLLPLGLLLLGSSALPKEETAEALATALVGWGLAALVYTAVGFAFQFGGVAVYPHLPDGSGLANLGQGWSPYDQTVPFEVSRLWRVIGLTGYFLNDPANTPDALSLFASHLAILGVMVIPSALVLHNRARRPALALSSLLLGGLVYPLLGNWIWGGGWLQNLGASLGYGHGAIDFGGAFVFAGAGVAALSALLVFRPAHAPPATASASQSGEQIIPMPPAHLPLLGLLGAGLSLVGMTTLVDAPHLSQVWNIDAGRILVNLWLAGLSGGLAAAVYSWFATSRFHPFMTPRGIFSGLAVISAGAPFVPVWVAVATGFLAGLTLPLLIFLFERVFRLDDRPAALSTLGVYGLLALLSAAVFADGTAGLGWNATLAETRLGVANQGVSGLLVAEGFASDWPSQLIAQGIGAAATLIWVFGMTFIPYRVLAGIFRTWERTRPDRPATDSLELPLDSREGPLHGQTIEQGET